ncbi:hypothetical protein FOPG_14779 [Fusarium oxysporum f. sp. conglutinans race 2 54008]|uniref:Methyltransferase domain-containing protein n=2 Tax=Fusarium oxysporum f. sp. conglutinans TaxID=100902 RepID=A0A8H6LGH1_FUSOX|nr:hypothetical protein FOPG_14779 [Fusarium oxysporum f. sp. conglutinans race 2 54008]KAF6518176.1 hypothetical protein HZS61_002254 [Fusarium oxysporum f. sp. conglutinans]KAG7000828.1 N-methyltransferase sirN [Fusarium oxysporum f. sp. conglutinans]
MAIDNYLLSRDSEETARLNEQHSVWTDVLGYLIHPDIEKSLPLNTKIADIATGTGIWALHVARNRPEATVDAIDISSSQFPPEETRPHNINFIVHDARDPFDAKHHDQYDMIHVRAVVAGMKEADWKLIVDNMFRMLKPGGYLQWAEADLSRPAVLRNGNAPVSFKFLPNLMKKWEADLSQRDLSGPRRLAELITSAGGSEVSVDIFSSDRLPEVRSTITLNYVKAILGSAASEDTEAIRRGVEEDIAAGAYVRFDNYVTTARRLFN